MSDKPEQTPPTEPDPLDREFDAALFRSGVRGKYHRRASQGTNVVRLAPDVAAAFRDEQSVNDALRMLMEIARRSADSSGTEPRKTA